MSDDDRTPKKRTARRPDIHAAARFIEELSWLLASHADLDFRSLRRLRVETEQSRTPDLLERFAPKNPNVTYLVGTLPGLFMDSALFPNNEDIAEFSATALKIKIPRWEKKAKFELVGHIVCHAVSLDDLQVRSLVRALTKLVDGEHNARKLFVSRKEQGMTWNEIIQNLISGEV